MLHVQSTHDVDTTVSRLQTAWQMVVDRHQALRTVFVEVEGRFQQLVLKKVSAYFQICKFSDLEDEEAVINRLKTLPPPSFKPSQPQHRLTICCAGVNEVFLKFEISHALVDGGSTGCWEREGRHRRH